MTINATAPVAAIKNLADDIAADLTGTNELGDGSRDYREEDGVLYVDLYINDLFNEDGSAKPDVTYRVDVSLTLVDSERGSSES